MKIITALFNGRTTYKGMVTMIGVRALYVTIIGIVASILAFVSLKVSVMVYLLLSLAVPYIQYSTYQAVVKSEPDKKPYTFFVGKLCLNIIIAVIVYFITKQILSTVIDELIYMWSNGGFL